MLNCSRETAANNDQYDNNSANISAQNLQVLDISVAVPEASEALFYPPDGSLAARTLARSPTHSVVKAARPCKLVAGPCAGCVEMLKSTFSAQHR